MSDANKKEPVLWERCTMTCDNCEAPITESDEIKCPNCGERYCPVCVPVWCDACGQLIGSDPTKEAK